MPEVSVTSTRRMYHARAPKQKPVHHPHRNDGTVCLRAKSGPDGVHRQGKCQSRQLMENELNAPDKGGLC